jgi:putative hemolysin
MEIVIIFFDFVNGLFSMSEIALISARKQIRICSKGNKSAQIALELANAPNNFYRRFK